MAANKNKIVALAQRYTSKGQFEKAIAEYRKLIRTDPSDIRTWLKIGDLYTRMGARKEATETYIRVAEQYTHNGFHLKAIAVYKQVLNIDPTLVVIHQYLAASYLELGLTSEALIQLEQLADVYERTARNDLLLEVLLQMGKIDPHNIATRLRVAELLSKENRVAEASKHFAGACEELKLQGRREDFLKVAERLLYHDPSRVDTALEVATIYVGRRQYKEALAKLQVCFVKDRRNVEVLTLLTKAFLGLGQPEKAVSVMTELAEVLAAARDESRRKAVLEEILSIDPNNEAALAALGKKSSSTVDLEEQSLNHAVLGDDVDIIGETSSSGIDLLADLTAAENMSAEETAGQRSERLGEVQVLLKYGLKERALEHLQKLLEADPYNIDGRELARDILLSMDRKAEALEHLFLLAEVFKDTQPEGSIYYLHEVLKADKQNNRARDMIRRLGGIMPEGMEEEISSVLGEEPPLLEDDDDILLIDDDDLQQADAVLETDGADAEWADWDVVSDPAQVRDSMTPIIDLTPDIAVAAENTTVEVVEYIEEPLEIDEDFDDIAIEAEGDGGDGEDEVEIEEEFDPNAPALIRITPDTRPLRAFKAEDELVSELPEPFAAEAGSSAPEPAPLSEPGPLSEPEPAPSPEPAELPEIDDDLEEVEFFLDQELFEEAETALFELTARYPNDPRIAALMQRLREAQGDAEPPASAEEPANEMKSDIPPSSVAHPSNRSSNEGSVQFKHVGIKEKISDSDSATAWDLGLAYKEMGLFEDAIQAFEIAARAPMRTAMGKTMLGVCYNALSRTDEAVMTFNEGLALPNLSDNDRMALLYELGKVYQNSGKLEDAVECYSRIHETDAGFADVAERLTSLSEVGHAAAEH